MTEVYLLTGSNMGHRTQELEHAAKLIECRCGKIIKRSSVFETEAWGFKEQNNFLNQALFLQTQLSPTDLLATLKDIEKECGREESTHWGPRLIDIDILFYGTEIISHPQLVIPHPHLHERKFTLQPLLQIAPDLAHPVLNKTITDLFHQCTDNAAVKVFAE